MKIKFFVFAFFVLFSNFIFAKVNIGILKGEASIPFAQMYSENSESYSFELFSKPQELFSKMQSGLIDATIISSLSAEELVKETNGEITVLAVTSTTDFFIVGKTHGKINLSALLGKSVCVGGNGLSYKMFSYLLRENQIPFEENNGVNNENGGNNVGVNIVVKQNQSSALYSFLNSEVDYVLLSGQALQEVLSRSKNYTKNIDLQEQFQILNGNDKIVPFTVLVARTKFCKEQQKLVQDLKNDVETSIEEAVKKPNITSKIIEQNNFGLSRKNCAKTIQNTNFNFIPINEDFSVSKILK